MDIVLATIVLGAVIFFGALISAGNERQRKALDGIREQAAQWAMQDLRLKREKLAREVQVDDPLAWLNQVVAKAYGEELSLTVSQAFDNPPALACTTGDGRNVVLSPVSPAEFRGPGNGRKSRLSRLGNVHPLGRLSHNMETIELSILNGGVFFDLELAIAWESLTGKYIKDLDKIWVYFG